MSFSFIEDSIAIIKATNRFPIRLGVLLAAAYPLAVASGIFYAFLSPFAVFKCWNLVIKCLEVGLNLPLRCARNMIDAKQLVDM